MDFVHADNGTAVQLLVNEQYGENWTMKLLKNSWRCLSGTRKSIFAYTRDHTDAKDSGTYEQVQRYRYDIALVQRLLQHGSVAVTQRYIGIEPQRIEAAIQGHAQLL